MARKPRYLELTIEGKVAETPSPGWFQKRAFSSFYELLSILDKARTSSKTAALLLKVKKNGLGWAQAEEIRRQLLEWAPAGKTVYAYLEEPDATDYFLSTGASRILAPPPATLNLIGLRAEVFLLRGLLDRLGIIPQLLRIGRYKSAAELFTHTDMSEESRQVLQSILRGRQDQLDEATSMHRKIDQTKAHELVTSGPYTAASALAAGLIDELAYSDELNDLLEEEFPGIKRVKTSRFLPGEGWLKRKLTWWRPQIAVIPAEGTIHLGKRGLPFPGRRTITSDGLIDVLQWARGSRRIKGAVLRISSPGGSGLASDLIWREARLLADKKPLVISFGDTAASGGYYIALAGDKILSDRGTLTGSIGAIQGKFVCKEAVQRTGINVDAVETSPRAGYGSAFRPFSQEELQITENTLREFYEDLFLSKVQEARNLDLEQSRTLAEGRVWSGKEAEENGLVDSIGGLMEALQEVRIASGLEGKKVRLAVLYQRPGIRSVLSGGLQIREWLETVLQDLSGFRL